MGIRQVRLLEPSATQASSRFLPSMWHAALGGRQLAALPALPPPPQLCVRVPYLQVYWSNACQIIPPHDAGIAAAIEGNLALWELPPLAAVTYDHPLVCDPLQQVAERYYERLRQQLHYRSDEANAAAPAVAYTALHGVGTPWLLRAFQACGLPAPVLVQQQCQPDPDFSTGGRTRALCCCRLGHKQVQYLCMHAASD